jgi:hypothetical protein
MKSLYQKLFTLLLCVLIAHTATALDVLVSTSVQLAAACSNAASGHVIKIAAGTYDGPFSLVGKSNVTLTSYNGTVFLRGNANAATNGMIILYIENSSNITVTGLKFTRNWGNFADGIQIRGSGNSVNISNNEFYDIGWSQSKTTLPNAGQNAHALAVVGSTATSYTNVFIGGNTIRDCITGYSESLTIAGNVSNFLIENNTLYGNTNIGIDCTGHYAWTGAPANVNYARSGIIRNNTVRDYAGPAALDAAGGIYIDGGSFITVENNKVYNYKIGFSVGCETPGETNSGNIVRNNQAYNCSLSGIFVGSNQSNSVVQNTQITNNTFYKNGFGTFDNGQIAFQNNSGTIVKNNIIYPTNGRFALVQMSGTTSTSPTISYNLYYRDNADVTNLYLTVNGDASAVKQNPLFVNAASSNFHIQSTSPAINAGDPGFVAASGETDMDAQTRVQNSRVDIGADEVATSGGTIPAAPTGLTASAASSSQINLSWSASSGATSYSVERSTSSGGTFTQIVSGLGSPSYNNTGLSASTTYYYRVKASNASGSSSASSQASATTQASGGTTVTVDGNASEWSAKPSISTNGTGGVTTLKAADNGTYLFVLAQGTSISTNYEIFIDSDNDNTGSGEYTASSWPSTGFNYMVENGTLFAYTGTGATWAWSSLGAVTAVKNTTVLEARIPKSSLGTLSSTIKIAVNSIDGSWVKVGFVPASGGSGASYVVGSVGGRKAGAEQEIFSEENLSREAMSVYPNPARSSVTVEYTTRAETFVSIDLMDVTGRQIRNCDNGIRHAGHHKQTIDVATSGLYLLKVFHEGKTEHKLIRIE